MTNKKTSKKSIVDFSVSLVNAIETFGMEKLTTFLSFLQPLSKEIVEDDSLSEVVIQVICTKYQIRFSELVSMKKIHGKYNDAMCLLCYLLKKYSHYSAKKISFVIQKNKSQVSKYLSRISLLREKVSVEDDRLIQTLNEIEIQIKKTIENGKENARSPQENFGD